MLEVGATGWWPILYVGESEDPPAGCLAYSLYHIQYEFSENYPSDGFAAWAVEPTGPNECITVAAYCRGFDGGFRHQALNRFVVQAILRERPAVLIIHGLSGCTADLPRIARMLGIPCILILSGCESPIDSCDESALNWIRDSINSCLHIVGDVDRFWGDASRLGLVSQHQVEEDRLPELLDALLESRQVKHEFSYSLYDFSHRDHPLLVNMQQPDTEHFTGCDRVLDVGSGVGIFLDCLRRRGIDGIGVERDPLVAEYGRGMGFEVITQDALEFLESSGEKYCGIYCSHFVEHLPVDAVKNLLHHLYRCLRPGGPAVMVFPDPESIRSQLLGFWRDPEHVRYYHPELIASMATAVGFKVEWTSYEAQPHDIAPFATEPERLPKITGLQPPLFEKLHSQQSWLESILAKLGWRSSRHLQKMNEDWEDWATSVYHAFHEQQKYIDKLKDRTDALWSVNQTWAWNDNATIRLRKPQDDGHEEKIQQPSHLSD